MEELFSKETKSQLLKLGIYQIVGGAAGILMLIWSIYQDPLLTMLTIFMYLIVLLFFAYSLFCGTLCLETKKNALLHSKANQILQLIGFAMLGFAFKYVAGIYLTVGFDMTESIKIGFSAGISKLDFSLNRESDRLEIDFNLIAFALIYQIDKIIKKVKEKAVLNQISSIGEV